MKEKLQSMLLAASASAMLMTMAGGAVAQNAGASPGGGPPRGMMGPMDRAGTIERFGLNDATLKLTAAQKAEIDKAADAYVSESTALGTKYPMSPGSPPSQEGMAARMKSRESFTAAVSKVLNDEQRKSWEAAQAARRPPGGGMMGPGAGMGPPGGRPPGQ